MAVNQDELYAALHEQALARRGGGSASPALKRMQSLDPAINPPPPPRNVTPAALTPSQPARRPGALPAGRQGGPAPLPAIAAPRPTPKPVAAQPGITHVGRAGMPTQTIQAGHGRGAAATLAPAVQPPPAKTTARPANPLNPLNGNVETAIPSGSAAALPSSASVLSAQEPTTGPPPPAGPLGKITRKGSSFSAPDDAGSVTLADARSAGKGGGSLSVIGMGLSPEATVAKLKGQTEQARQLNRMKETGLSEPELAKVDARRGKDSEIFQLSQSGISPEQAAGAIFQRDAALAKQTAVAPVSAEQSALNQQALLKGEQGLQQGALGLQKGEAELQKGEEERSMLTELQNLDPNKPESKALGESIIQRILLGRGDYKQPVAQKSLGHGALTDPITGETKTYSKDTGGINAPAAQGAAQPDGAELIGKDGQRYIVKDGVPVLA